MFGGARVYTAAGYYRHSAEDKQENSVPIQREHAQKFASENSIQIIHEEKDEGKSGLSAARPGFERLFQNWVLNPEAPHLDYILVYDVTRWGRFQDPDEAAYWEMQCKKRGIHVIYVSRGFPKEEERLLSSLETSIGRYMAAEYSRQLSNKVFHGSIKVAEQGYSAGGKAPYGLTRILLDEQRNVIGELKPGEHKVIANQRVTFAPANDESRQIVKRMFDELIDNSRHPKKIADSLNNEGIFSPEGKRWDAQKITHILSNEQYAGTLIYNKTWKRLKQPSRRNPMSEWVRHEDAFEGIVTKEQFEATQERLYWLLPARHRYGIYRLNAARRQFKQYLRQQAEQLQDDDRFKVLHNFPITFSLNFYRNEEAKRCFAITDRHRLHDEVLCVGVDMFAKDKVDAIYRLPSKLFGVGDFLVVRDNDDYFKQYIINTTDTDPIIDKMCRELITS